MTDSFVTQCPNCRTSFRVNRAQLGAANGAVRCGACLHVYNAAQQLLSEAVSAVKPARPAAPGTATPTSSPAQPATSQSQARTAVPAPAPAPAQTASPGVAPSSKPASKLDTLWIHDDLDLDSLDLDEELAKLEAAEQQLSQDFLALRPAAPPAPRLLDDATAAPQSTPLPELLAAEDQQALRDSAPRASFLDDNSSSVADEAPCEALRAERDELPSADEPAQALDSEPDEPRIGRLDNTAEEQQDTPRHEPSLRAGSLLDLSNEPLQLDWQRPSKPWGRWIGWGLLNLLAAGALAGQYVTYHFAELARQDQYRPWFEQICPELGCTLPSKVDIELIKSSNLVVRSHPQFPDALVVDAILYNRASFTQPFPLLELRFADIQGQLLASRRFKPGEYLAGELAGRSEMPPQVPIRVSLEILDPGTQAVNYSLSFHSPE